MDLSRVNFGKTHHSSTSVPASCCHKTALAGVGLFRVTSYMEGANERGQLVIGYFDSPAVAPHLVHTALTEGLGTRACVRRVMSLVMVMRFARDALGGSDYSRAGGGGCGASSHREIRRE